MILKVFSNLLDSVILFYDSNLPRITKLLFPHRSPVHFPRGCTSAWANTAGRASGSPCFLSASLSCGQYLNKLYNSLARSSSDMFRLINTYCNKVLSSTSAPPPNFSKLPPSMLLSPMIVFSAMVMTQKDNFKFILIPPPWASAVFPVIFSHQFFSHNFQHLIDRGTYGKLKDMMGIYLCDPFTLTSTQSSFSHSMSSDTCAGFGQYNAADISACPAAISVLIHTMNAKSQTYTVLCNPTATSNTHTCLFSPQYLLNYSQCCLEYTAHTDIIC